MDRDLEQSLLSQALEEKRSINSSILDSWKRLGMGHQGGVYIKERNERNSLVWVKVTTLVLKDQLYHLVTWARCSQVAFKDINAVGKLDVLTFYQTYFHGFDSLSCQYHRFPASIIGEQVLPALLITMILPLKIAPGTNTHLWIFVWRNKRGGRKGRGRGDITCSRVCQ